MKTDPLHATLLEIRDQIVDAIIVAEEESKRTDVSEEFRRNEVFIAVGLRRAEEIVLNEIMRLERKRTG